ncbi:melanoma antigen family B 4 [Cricetulus griseus]
MLMQYLLCKYKMKQPMNKGEMLKIVNKRFKEQFPDILKKASERIQLVFGLEVKQIKPNSSYYTLVSKLDPGQDRALTTGLPFPQNGLLMPLLGVIFLNGNRASEAEIWEFLNILGIYDGKAHIIFGEPRKLVTKDLVKEKYLEYRKVPGSDPPSYEFLWGPRARAETTKMKVLEFLAKVNETVPQAFPSHYEEALRDQEERAQAEAVGGHGTTAKGKAEFEVAPAPWPSAAWSRTRAAASSAPGASEPGPWAAAVHLTAGPGGLDKGHGAPWGQKGRWRPSCVVLAVLKLPGLQSANVPRGSQTAALGGRPIGGSEAQGCLDPPQLAAIAAT